MNTLTREETSNEQGPSLMPGMRTFEGPSLLQIAMPMGGIGAGCVCLAGNGALCDWSIRNKPATSATADGHHTREAAFGILHVKGARPVTRLIEGPMPVEKIYDQGLKAQGYRVGAYEGLPRFASARFTSGYPFGVVELSHPDAPLNVSITGWSPLIPLDDRHSSMPCAILEYRFENETGSEVQFEFSYHLSHIVEGQGKRSARNAAVPGFGVDFTNTDSPNRDTFGSAFMGVVGHEPRIKAMWFRGGWFDSISALWRELAAGTFAENDGQSHGDIEGNNGGSILIPCTLPPGEAVVFPILIAWHMPNVNLVVGQDKSKTAAVSLPVAQDPATAPPAWRPYYAGQWATAAAVAAHVREHYRTLRRRTLAFRDALFSSTAPPQVIDAVASNLAILKSPTILRQENGNVWAWEGCFATDGCCHGSCTHVWNYAQALPHLFPALERTLREAEYLRSLDDRGHVQFRAALPDTECCPHAFHAAADGQLGGILKLFRDWQISGDKAWLEKLQPLAKRSLDYCIATWDPDRRGALFEPHHNTYDIEFWGPDGMCTSIYVAALAAMAAMCRALGQTEAAGEYDALAKKGAAFIDATLFNGEYYEQKVQWKDLRDQSFSKLVADDQTPNPELLRLLRAEGPKYQYGSGCISDGVIGAWMARIYGVDTPQTTANVRRNLAAIFEHNFKKDLFDHANAQRPGYALGHEPGLLLCSWPHGGKPTLPFVYSDEVWTGIEYQVASHLISEGMVEQGLEIVAAARGRYEGHVRNPFNEYECGSYYARALASYAVLNSLSGFRYSAVTRTLHLAPELAERPFHAFISTASGFGMLMVAGNTITVNLVEGTLAIESLEWSQGEVKRSFPWKVTAQAGQAVSGKFQI